MLRQYSCCFVDINTVSFPRGGQRQSSAVSHGCFITDVVTPGMDHFASPVLTLSHASRSPPHVRSFPAHDPFSPQYNPVTVFSMLFRNLVTPWKGHVCTHTHSLHISGHSLMHEQSDMTPRVSPVTPLQSLHGVNNTHDHPL